jgi:hypothetical protein
VKNEINEPRKTGHLMRRNCFLEHVLKERQRRGQTLEDDEEEDVGRYWITLRKREDVVN